MLDWKVCWKSCARREIKVSRFYYFFQRFLVLKQNAECLLGMEQTVRPSCENSCIQRREKRVENLDDQCELAGCVAKCMDSQMAECFAENEGQVNKLYEFFSFYPLY